VNILRITFLTLVLAGPLYADYVSPFTIQLDPDIAAWTDDFSTRETAILANTSPAQADWYEPQYVPGSGPGSLTTYGVTLPQLFSAPAAPGTPGYASTESQLQFDRGTAVFGIDQNQAPTGVDVNYYNQQRLLAVAQSLIGTPYQHLHQPEFAPWQASGYSYWDGYNPPTQPPGSTQWNWNPVSSQAYLNSTQGLGSSDPSTTTPNQYQFANPYLAAYGQGQGGIDCTDFAAYIYNEALGIQLNSGTATQIRFNTNNNPYAYALDAQGNTLTPTFLESPNFASGNLNQEGDLDTIFAQLNAGDLLYIADQPGGTVLHVVVWLDQFVMLPDADGNMINAPLVISSHDNTPAIFDTLVLTDDGLPDLTVLGGDYADYLPPPGVHILPIVSGNWFYENFSVAMQVLPVPEPSSNMLLLLAAAGFGAYQLRLRFRRQ
jgi:cell wall-associated NlpC family hydrolase